MLMVTKLSSKNKDYTIDKMKESNHFSIFDHRREYWPISLTECGTVQFSNCLFGYS